MSGLTPKRIFIHFMGLITIIINLAFTLHFNQDQVIKQLSDKDLFQTLKRIAGEINETMPIVVERGLRCENVRALTGRKFQYNFTITDLLKKDVDTTLVKNFIAKRKPVLINAIRSDSSMQFFRQQNVIFIYTYRDKYSSYLYNITIQPENYQNTSH